MDLRKVPISQDIVCPECGVVYLVDIDDDGNSFLKCNQCNIKSGTVLLLLIELNGDEIKGDYICYNHMVYWKREAYK